MPQGNRRTSEENDVRRALELIKIIIEIAAFAFGAVFLLTKLIDGQANAAIDVSLLLERKVQGKSDADQLAITLKLKRSDVGRLQLSDITLDIIDLTEPANSKFGVRAPSVIVERQVSSKGEIGPGKSTNKLYLPPNDGTQLAYFAYVKRGSVVQVDVTLLARRTGLWLGGHPQWRTSAISLP